MKNLVNPLTLLILPLAFLWSCGDDEDSPSIEVTVQNFTASIDENPAKGAVIGTFNASVTEGTLSYQIVSQSPEGAIEINNSSGEITVADETLFDFETNPQITGSIRASAGSASQTGTFTISVNDIEEKVFTVWTGDKITFSKAAGSDPTDEANQDKITDNVWITRGNGGGQIFNIKVESASNKTNSPSDTEWAIGTTADVTTLTFQPFRSAVKPQEVVGKDLVLHLITDDVYLDVKFTAWSMSKAGGFAYERSTE